MPMYRVKLKEREEVAESTPAFYFEKPQGFIHEAGQHITLALVNPRETDEQGNMRVFSLASAPHEDFLMIAMRAGKSAFKRVLAAMPHGTEAEVAGPYGSFGLPTAADRPVVYLAGGIGITPFRSLVLDAEKKRLPHRIFLFTSNYSLKEAAFFRELHGVKNPNYTFVPAVTDMGKEWQGETGYINKEMIAKYVSDPMDAFYYIAGPPGMVLAMRTMLQETGVDPEDVRTEQFSGY